MRRALVFTRTKHGADSRAARTAGIAAEAIHGNKSQNARQRALRRFATARPGAGRDRHRRARHRRRRHHARGQFRPAERAGDLRAPHRPHRARRRVRARRCRSATSTSGVPARHRAAHPLFDPRDRQAHRTRSASEPQAVKNGSGRSQGAGNHGQAITVRANRGSGNRGSGNRGSSNRGTGQERAGQRAPLAPQR